MAEYKNNKRSSGSSKSFGEKKGDARGGEKRVRKTFTPRSSEKTEGGDEKKSSKKEKSFSRNKAFRSDRPTSSFKEGGYKGKEGGYKSKGSGFKPKPFNKSKEEGGESSSFSRNDKYSEKKRGSFADKEERKPYAKKEGAYGDKKFEDRGERKPYAKKEGGYGDKKFEDRGERKPYVKKEGGYGDKKFEDRGERKPYTKKEGGYEKKEGSYGDKKFGDRSERKPYVKKEGFESKEGGSSDKKFEDRGERKPYIKKEGSYEKKEGSYGDKKFGDRSERKPYSKNSDFKGKKTDSDSEPVVKRYKQDEFEDKIDYKKSDDYDRFKNSKRKTSKPIKKNDDGLTRLNKYLSNAGVASRREADVLIQSGVVKVNGIVVTEMGFKVKPGDDINYGGEAIKGERKVYLLLNKPKDCITTTEDPQERKTVMNLIKNACKERVYPVGRLDRNTTGLLLMTNDGEIAARLTHPKFNIKKVYQVSLTKGLKTEDMQQIIDGIELEDGFVKADEVAYVGEGKKEIGIEIHSGRNRIVRRIFEHLGYDVLKLDRVSFAGLTKKDLPRGKYRFLEPKEVAFLRMVGG
jgi:23S rRNA pseudouridine2605 synthase